jgi:hypothetical protein
MVNGDVGPGFEQLHPGGTDFAIDKSGNIYFSKWQSADLYLLHDLPTYEIPESDLVIYRDGIEPGWILKGTRCQVDVDSTEKVASGTCQRVDFEGYCQLQYSSSDIWGSLPWEYENLVLDINMGESTITDIILTKTGPGSTEKVSIIKDQLVDLAGDGWTRVEVPISTMGWVHGSRIESLSVILLGSGTLYIDSMALSVPECWISHVLLAAAGAVLSVISSRSE